MAASKEMELAIKIAGKIDSSFNSAMSKVTSTIGSAAKAMAAGTVAAAAAVRALTIKAINVGREYEQAMSQVQATMLLDTGTAEGAAAMETLENAARAAGRSTAFSATEAAEALNYLALAGYDADKAAAALPTVLNLAGAGAMDLAAASDMVTDSMSALGIEASQQNLEGFADSLAKAASTSNTSVSQLGEAILTVGGTAKLLKGGGTLEGMTELNTALGLLADNGIKGSEGGTKLRNMILSLTAPSNQAAEALANIGVSAFDEKGDMRDLQSIFADLNTAMDGMSTADRSELLSTIFNKTDLKAVNALLGTSEERWNELTGAVSDCAGACEDMYAIQIDNLNGDLAILKSGLEDLGISVYKDLQPALRSGAQLATDMVGKMATAYSEGGLAGLVASVGGCLSDVVNVMAEYAPQVVSIAIMLIDGFVAGLANNAAGIAMAGAGVIVSFVSGMSRLIPSVLLAGIDIILSLAAALADQLPALIASGQQAVSNLAQGLLQRLPAIITTGLTLIGALISGISASLPGMIQTGVQLIGGLLNGFIQMYPSLIEQGLTLVLSLVAAIIQNLPLIIQTGVLLITNLLSTITQNAQNFVTAGASLLRMLADGIIQSLPMIIQAAVQLVLALIAGIISMIPTLITAAPQMVDGFVDAIFETDWAAVGGDIIKGIGGGIIGGFGAIIDAVGGLFGSLGDFVFGDGGESPAPSNPGYTPQPASPASPASGRGMSTGNESPAPSLVNQGLASAQEAAAQSFGGGGRSFAEAGASDAQQYAAGIRSGSGGIIAATQQAANGGIQSIDLSAFVAQGQEGAQSFTSGLDESLAGYTFDPSSIGLDVSAFSTDLTTAAESGGTAFTSGLDSSLSGYSFDTSSIGVDTSALTATLTEGGEAGGQGLINGLTSAIEAGNFDPAAVANFDTRSITAMMQEAGTGGGQAFTTAIDSSVAAYNFNPASVGIDAGLMTSSMTESGTAGGQALTQSLQQAIASGTGAVVAAANSLGTGVNNAITQGFDRAKGSASSAMGTIYGICAGGAQRSAAAVKGAFENMTITIPRPRIPVVSVSSSSVSVGDQSVSVPRFSVSWNALGGIFRRPTIFNTANGLQGAGEKGPEAILPLDTLWAQMRQILREILQGESSTGGLVDSLLSKLQGIGGGNQGGGEMQLAGAGGETIYFSPTYNLYGSATQEDAERAGRATFEEFKKFMKQYERENRRTKF